MLSGPVRREDRPFRQQGDQRTYLPSWPSWSRLAAHRRSAAEEERVRISYRSLPMRTKCRSPSLVARNTDHQRLGWIPRRQESPSERG